MTVPDLVDRLAAHKTLGTAPREELAWLAAHGSLRQFKEGEIVIAEGELVAGLFVVLTGHIAIFVDREDRDGELTFKQAQILAIAGEAPSALVTLDEAVAQGFVCVTGFETSAVLEPVRALRGYRAVRERALARQLAFGRRFGLRNPPLLER